MSDKLDSSRSLTKLVDDGINNNYGEWETKAYHTLRSWDLVQYIEGPESDPPLIPDLIIGKTYRGMTADDVETTIHVRGNKEEHDIAKTKALPWMTANNLCLSKIVNAVPNINLHLVRRARYAREAWEALKKFYQPQNSLRAATLKADISSYRCQTNMNVSTWLNDMLRMYDTLYGTDPESMTDSSFTLAIIDNMPQDNDAWRGFLSDLRTKLRQYESSTPPTPIRSTEFITLIRDEYWFRHRDDPQMNSHVFSARSNADKRGTKRARDTHSTSFATAKRARGDKVCTNPSCGAKNGHEYSECIAFGGGSQGKYTEWWKGPWNIHLPKEKRDKSNNIPPESHPAFARIKSLAPKISALTYSHSTSRANTDEDLESSDGEPIVSMAVANETPNYVWSTQLDNEPIVASLPVLEHELEHSDHCYHDSGANRHVFHDRTAFEDYTSIQPLAVKGFGRKLSTVAIGRGTIRLRCYFEGHPSLILLTNVLHIPSARSNLISGVRLDKAGVTVKLGHGRIQLSHRGQPLVSGGIENDMYRLNLEIIRTFQNENVTQDFNDNIPHIAILNYQDPDFYIA
jgi:hypothetical protein